MRVFQHLNGIPASRALDRSTWAALARESQDPVLTRYTIQPEDVDGPFVGTIPDSMRRMAKMERLAYGSPQELLAEKFHMDPEFLRALNPGKNFGNAGTAIVVANVLGRQPSAKAVSIVVDKKNQAVKPYDDTGRLIAFYPATVGSDRFPSPSGKLKVKAIAERPTFTYSAELDYSDLKKGEKLVIPPGPNNPVGLVWIDLSKEGYGIHGTPDPARISKAASHGCVRLTNWDATELSKDRRTGSAGAVCRMTGPPSPRS